MDGKNASGRRISLLNDNPHPPHPVRTSSFTPSLHSQRSSSSSASSPLQSPPTPPRLMRSISSDSTASMQTPSPITPDFAFDGLPPQSLTSPVFAQASFFPAHKDLNSAYPLLPQHVGPSPYHPANPPQPAYYRPQPPAENPPPSSANPRSKKNSYPCPVAKQYNCNDYFTTSGHAARHAKKHTGKKDAFCPECNKAFTRKDNMEQHRRTHQSGRNAPKPTDSSMAKKAKQQAKRPRPAPIQSSLPMPPLSSLSMLDPNLSQSPSGPTFVVPSAQSVDSFNDYLQRSPYPDPATYAMTHNFPASSSYGLDALAIAASGEKRKFES